jgi:hypothetical protein
MFTRMLRCLGIVILLFACHTSLKASTRIYDDKQFVTRHQLEADDISDNGLYAEASVIIHLPVLKLNVQAGDLFNVADDAKGFNADAELLIGNVSRISAFRFYRRILFPFHGFW